MYETKRTGPEHRLIAVGSDLGARVRGYILSSHFLEYIGKLCTLTATDSGRVRVSARVTRYILSNHFLEHVAVDKLCTLTATGVI